MNCEPLSNSLFNIPFQSLLTLSTWNVSQYSCFQYIHIPTPLLFYLFSPSRVNQPPFTQYLNPKIWMLSLTSSFVFIPLPPICAVSTKHYVYIFSWICTQPPPKITAPDLASQILLLQWFSNLGHILEYLKK